jgi:hypothetical protein
MVQDGLRHWSADFQLHAHFLNLRCLSFELRRENFHSLPKFLDFAILLEELIEQHRVHLILAHAVGLSIFVAHDEIRIHLGSAIKTNWGVSVVSLL